MGKSRLEAFSDGVIAILITIMVLELKVPHEPTMDALGPLWPVFLSYVLSFIYLGIYWNNHHHMLHTVKHVTGGILWANLHLLFWLSLVPFVTGWMGENHFAAQPTAVYGVVLLMAAISYWILQRLIIRAQGPGSLLQKAVGGDWKGNLSPVVYVAGIATSFVAPGVGFALYAVVAAIWLVPVAASNAPSTTTAEPLPLRPPPGRRLVQAHHVAFGVGHQRDVPRIADVGHRHHHAAARRLSPFHGARQVLARVQVDDGAARRGLQVRVAHQRAAHAVHGLIVGKHRHGVAAAHLVPELCDAEHPAVEGGGAGEVGDGNLEPVDRVHVRLL